MPTPIVGQHMFHPAPLTASAAESAVAAAQRARAAYAIRDARHRRAGQGALAESVLKLRPRRR